MVSDFLIQSDTVLIRVLQCSLPYSVLTFAYYPLGTFYDQGDSGVSDPLIKPATVPIALSVILTLLDSSHSLQLSPALSSSLVTAPVDSSGSVRQE